MTDKPPTKPPAATQSQTSATSTDAAPRPGKRSGFRTLVGYHALDWREGYAEMELDLAETHMNSNGTTHGGVVMTIIDAAMGHAATWCSVPGHARYCATMSLTTSFLVPPRQGDRLRAVGRLISIDHRVATCVAEARNQSGEIVAVAQASFRYATGSEHVEGVPRRPHR